MAATSKSMVGCANAALSLSSRSSAATAMTNFITDKARNHRSVDHRKRIGDANKLQRLHISSKVAPDGAEELSAKELHRALLYLKRESDNSESIFRHVSEEQYRAFSITGKLHSFSLFLFPTSSQTYVCKMGMVDLPC